MFGRNIAAQRIQCVSVCTVYGAGVARCATIRDATRSARALAGSACRSGSLFRLPFVAATSGRDIRLAANCKNKPAPSCIGELVCARLGLQLRRSPTHLRRGPRASRKPAGGAILSGLANAIYRRFKSCQAHDLGHTARPICAVLRRSVAELAARARGRECARESAGSWPDCAVSCAPQRCASACIRVVGCSLQLVGREPAIESSDERARRPSIKLGDGNCANCGSASEY